MKKLALLFLLTPYLVLAQNPFTKRSDKTEISPEKSFEYETIDGRLSSRAHNYQAVAFTKPDLSKTDVKYAVRYAENTELPIWIDVLAPRNDEGHLSNKPLNQFSISTVLEDLASLLHWNENVGFNRTKTVYDSLGMQHDFYSATYKNILINGGDFVMHSQFQNVHAISGRFYPSIDVNVIPTIKKSQAFTIAEEHAESLHQQNTDAGHIHLGSKSNAQLLVDYDLYDSLIPTLVYKVTARPDQLHVYQLLIDAQTGEILKVIDELCSIDGPKTATATDLNGQSRTINTYQVGSTYYLIDGTKSMFNSGQSSLPDDPVGAIWTIDAQNSPGTSFYHVSSSNNTWSDASSVSAHYNAGLAFDYFANTHSRNSINGSGGTIVSIVNVADQGGGSLENAYWNGQAMFYGNGGSVFYPLAGALDVAGHELTHGVVSNSANLVYEGQSGAINESMADVFGAMIDRDDWKMGEDVVKPGQFPGGALRNLQSPHNGGNSLSDRGYQPERMAEYYTGSQDNYGVHINSGIVNRAFYLAATAMNKNKAEKIWYRALTLYLTTKSKFLDLRYACIQAAGDLYGTTEENAVKSAFDTVEIYDPNGGSGGGSGGSGGGTDLPSNPGDEFIISVDIDQNNSNTFYKSTTTPDGWQALSTTTPKRKATVTDDGSAMYYVASNDAMFRILLESPFTEAQVSNDAWDNVAVSKDGNLIAAISTSVDSAIWVYNFTTALWKEFRLYNPTYSTGVNAGNVLYADAIEFDNTGQYILYDARNVITNPNGSDIDYWDVGVIRVWDKEVTTWGDGKIEKVFTQLPDGISIGNATYAKNSPYIIAFDYIDATNNQYAVLGANTITGTSGTIFSNLRLGYPNYSNDDDHLIFDAEDVNGDELIARIGLGADKITSSGTAAGYIGAAKWGVWYANGTRSLLSPEKDILSFAFPSLPGQPEAVITGATITIEVPTSTNLTSLVPTFTHSEESVVSVSNATQTSGVSSQNFSNNLIYKVTAQDGSSKNYIVTVNQSASINEESIVLSLYPNPAKNEIHMSCNKEIIKATIYSIDGKIQLQNNTSVLSLNGMSPGVYAVKVETEKGLIIKKFNKL